jgi:DNA-binding transcriptional LysR family regulator
MSRCIALQSPALHYYAEANAIVDETAMLVCLLPTDTYVDLRDAVAQRGKVESFHVGGHMFELTQLRSFVALAEELHFSRAAQRLNMTQPPLSRQIQQLEQILGVQLFERSSRFVRLTAAGKAFLVEARTILRSSEEAMMVARRVAHGEGGTITLGFIPAASYSLVPRLLAFAAAEMPQVQFVLKEMVTADQAEALASARIDAGVLRMPIDVRGFEAVPIDRQRFVLAVQAGHKLAGGRLLTVKHLAGQPLIMYAPTESRYHYDLVSSVFRVAGITPNFVQYAREIHTMLSLVSAGFGVALVPEAAGSLGFAGVELQPIKLTPQVFSELTLVWRKRGDNPALRVYTEEVIPRFLADELNDTERAYLNHKNVLVRSAS